MTIDIKLHRKLDAEANSGDWIALNWIALMRNDHLAMLDLIEAQAAEIELLKRRAHFCHHDDSSWCTEECTLSAQDAVFRLYQALDEIGRLKLRLDGQRSTSPGQTNMGYPK